MSFNTPILFLVFNRPDTTQKVFEAIKAIQPQKLYVAADGARKNKLGEEDLCSQVRAIIKNGIDWDCELHTLFREENLGCGKAIQGALDWFFEYEEEGIILEDDTLPNNDFFYYCSTLLQRYRHDEKVFSINGCSLGYSNKQNNYGLTKYFNMWGWATWRRSNSIVQKVWNKYTLNLLEDPVMKKRLKLPTIWDSKGWFKLWQWNFERTYKGEIDTWDYQWVYAILKSNTFSIRPGQNYIVNLGFNSTATHTTDQENRLGYLNFGKKNFMPNILPNKLIKDRNYEIKFVAKVWNRYDVMKRSVFYKIISEIKGKVVRACLKIKFQLAIMW